MIYHINYFIRTIVNYIFRYLPWVIIGVLICTYDVHALNITPDTCHVYYPSSTKQGSIDNYSINGQTWHSCKVSGATENQYGVRFYFSNIAHGKTGVGMVTFSVRAKANAQISHAIFTSSNNDYACSVSTGAVLTDDSDGLQTYYVACNNIPLVSNQNFFVRLYSKDNGVSNIGAYIQTGFNFYSSSEVGQIIANQQQQTNNKLDEMNDNITSSDTDNDNVSNTLNSVTLGDEGVITQLITLPINLFTNILNAINGQCKSFNLGNFFGTNLTLPCINIQNIVGSNLWSIIDILFSGFAIYYIGNKVKRIFEHITNLREGDILND